MENMGKKAALLVAAFASVAGLGAAYHYRNDIAFAACDLIHPAWNAGEARLSDAFGRRFSLLNNGDGTETALYDNDTAVTFRRDTAGNLIWTYGTASLLAPIAAHYFAFHGFSYPGGAMDADAMIYRVRGTIEPFPAPYTAGKTGRTHGHGVSHVFTGRSGDYESKRSDQSGSISRKSGFGRAGIRSSGGS